MVKECSLRTENWTKMLWSSKPLPGLCVAVSENMILKGGSCFSFCYEAALEQDLELRI